MKTACLGSFHVCTDTGTSLLFLSDHDDAHSAGGGGEVGGGGGSAEEGR
jgi:hypothetical protein